jgi:hypothetical protein
MSLTTFSAFYFGSNIDTTNNMLPFSEGGPELTADLDPGLYSMTQLMTAVKTALDAEGAEVYTVTFDRDTRLVTIAATGVFELLLSSGASVGLSPFQLLGFTAGVDLTGLSSYTGSSPAGSEYTNQFILQDYVEPENFKEKVDPAVSESADGVIQTVSFGTRRFIEMNMKFITNKPGDCVNIRGNSTGVADAQTFLTAIIDKSTFEFMPDISDRLTFFTVILESTPEAGNGTGYRLKEQIGDNLPGYYQTGKLKLRVVD